MSELVSVIVPVYNTGEYLVPCIKSLIAQTYDNLEIILVDDGSTDGGGAICDEFARRDGRVKVIHQQNAGVSTARNAGLDAMHGQYFLFVDADDSLEPNTIDLAMAGFHNEPVNAVFFGVTKIWQEEGRKEKLHMEVGTFGRTEMIRGILKDYASYGSGFPFNKVWRVSSFGSCADVPRFDRELYYFEDMEWAIRMLLRSRRAKLLPEYCYHYHIRAASVTHRPGIQERRELGYHRSVQKMMDALVAEPEIFHWFSEKYYPEIVNGVIHAKRHRWTELGAYLLERLQELKYEILNARSIPRKIKFRCRVLLIMQALSLL